MLDRFKLFKPIYVDHYDSSFREGSEFRYTLFEKKNEIRSNLSFLIFKENLTTALIFQPTQCDA